MNKKKLWGYVFGWAFLAFFIIAYGVEEFYPHVLSDSFVDTVVNVDLITTLFFLVMMVLYHMVVIKNGDKFIKEMREKGAEDQHIKAFVQQFENKNKLPLHLTGLIPAVQVYMLDYHMAGAVLIGCSLMSAYIRMFMKPKFSQENLALLVD